MKKLCFLSAFVLATALAASSHASILGQMLNFNGTNNNVTDNSGGVFSDSDTDGDSVPDLVQGIVFFDSINGNTVFPVTGGSLFAVYSFTITETSLGSGIFTSVATTGANSATNMISGALSADFSGLSTYNASVVDPAVIVFSTSGDYSHFDWANTAAPGSPISLDFTPTATPSDFTIFDVEMTLGLVGDDYHRIRISDFGTPLGNFQGVYTVGADVLPGAIYLPIAVPASGFYGSGAAAGDVVITNGTISGPESDEFNERGFNFADRGTYRLQALPEPFSGIVWLSLAGAMALGFKCRKSFTRV